MLVDGMDAEEQEKFDRMLNQMSPEELNDLAARAAREAAAPVKVAPSWWDES